MRKILLICLAIVVLFSSCEDMFEPEIENNLELQNAYTNATYAQGLLLNGYTRIPTNSWSFNDVATDAECFFADKFHSGAVGEQANIFQHDSLAFSQGLNHCIGVECFDADNLDMGRNTLDIGTNSGNEPTATDTAKHSLQVL